MKFNKSIILFLIVAFSFGSKFHSLALPGLGEHKSNLKKRSLGFFVAESCLWLGLYYSSNSSQWYEEDYIAFAQVHASTSLTPRTNQYYINLSSYDNIYDYNTAMQQQRNPDAVYDVDDYYWDWSSSINQRKFSSYRYKAGLYNKYTKFLLAGLILNRIVSFIDMLYIERFNQPSTLSSEIKIEGDTGLTMTVSFNVD